MTRWKREATATILLMHEHHLWSRWNDAILRAASELGLLVGSMRYPNCSGDGSQDREWYVPAAQYERVGGWAALRDRAEALLTEAA